MKQLLTVNLIVLSFLVSVDLHALESNTGRSIQPHGTLSNPTYPNSGMTRHRSNDITGKDMSDTTMSTNENVSVPRKNPTVDRDVQEEQSIKSGPYSDEARYHHEEGLDGRKAQEAAEEGRIREYSEKEFNRKQQGY